MMLKENELSLEKKQLEERCKAMELKSIETDERLLAVEKKEKEVDEHSKALVLNEKKINVFSKELKLKEEELNERCRILKLKEKQINVDCQLKELKKKISDERRILSRCQTQEFMEKQIVSSSQELVPADSDVAHVACVVGSSSSKDGADVQSLCRNMDADGLRSYLIANFKEQKALHERFWMLLNVHQILESLLLRFLKAFTKRSQTNIKPQLIKVAVYFCWRS
ncbi:Microtubule-associated protein 1A [Bienertia sinuspersici]